MEPALVSVLLLAAVSLVVVFPSMRGHPGLGVMAGLLIVAAATLARGEGLASLGLAAPPSWSRTVALAVVLGLAIAFISQVVIDPLVERATGHPHQLGPVDSVRGSLKGLVVVVASVWVLVVFAEEILYRGFLMTEVTRVLGTEPPALVVALLLSSAVFGLSHWYQGPSGVWSSGLVGLLLGVIFIYRDFNLWLPILVHGVVDTVLLTLIYMNRDERLKRLLFG